MEPRYSCIAYYNRAYVAIVAKMDNHKQNVRDDIQAAMDSLDLYIIAEVSAVVQLAGIVTENREFKERETEYKGEEEKCLILILSTIEILRFIKEKELARMYIA